MLEVNRGTREEVGSRGTFFALKGINGLQRPLISWLLKPSGELPESKSLSDETAELMASRLGSPFQIIQYLGLGVKEADQIGQKPVTAERVDGVLRKMSMD